MINQYIYIIILNWNGFQDTIECLESIYRSKEIPYKVILCDNDSADNSIEQISKWANGKLCAYVPLISSLRRLSCPPIAKPLDYRIIDHEFYESTINFPSINTSLTIVKNQKNLGFAGGNNVGIRLAINQPDCSFVWLLNNDTVVEPSALIELIERYKESENINSICGSTLLYYDKTDTIQALGGASYNKWVAHSKQIGNSRKFNIDDALKNRSSIERQIYSLQGASMFFPKHFFVDIGEISEDYFLYFEEQDISASCKETYKLIYAPKSIVYHKEGSSIGASNINPAEKSFLSSIFSLRSRIIFTKKFFPYAIPVVYLSLLYFFLNRIRRGQKKQIPLLLKIIFKIDMSIDEIIELYQNANL